MIRELERTGELDEQGLSTSVGEEKVFVTTRSLIVRLPMESASYRLPLELTLITNKEVDARRLFEKAKGSIIQSSNWLLPGVLNGMGLLNGVENPNLHLRNRRDIRFLDDIIWLRRAYDLDVTLIVHVDGRGLIEEIDCTAALEKARKYDEEYQEKLRLFDLAFEEKWRAEKEKTLSHFVDDMIEWADHDRLLFQATAEENTLTPNGLTSLNEKDLVQRLAEKIGDFEFVNGHASPEEIKEVLEQKRSEGEFEIVPVIVYLVKLSEREKGI